MKTKYRFTIVLILLHFIISNTVFSQNRASNWGFKYHGMKFLYDSVYILDDFSVPNNRGMGMMSDLSGNLLLYCDGTTIWNKNHEQMENGDDICNFGHYYPRRSMIIPFIEDHQKYYVFSLLGGVYEGNDGLYVSIVDLNLNDGLGKVIEKGIYIQDSLCHYFTAVNHANGKDTWLIMHKFESDIYYTRLITESGISEPIISQVGMLIKRSVRGQLKASPDGTKVAFAYDHWSVHNGEGFDVIQFNNETGVLSEAISFRTNQRSVNACEFSPNSQILYVNQTGSTGEETLFQYDVSVHDSARIDQSRITLFKPMESGLYEMQMATDGKIYISKGGGHCDDILAVIHKPNKLGLACNAIELGLEVPYCFTSLMPNFNQSYFFQPHVEIHNTCLGDTATLQSSYNAMMDSIIWDLGDGSFSKEYLVKHVYEGSGDYTPKLIVYYNDTRIDTLEYDLQIFSGPDISLGADTTACLGFGWNFENFEYPILWNDSIVDDKFYPHDSEEVRISVMDEHLCETYDTAYVEILDLPEFSLGNDENICDGDSLLMKPDIAYENFNYLWNTGDTTNYIFVKTENEYTLEITSIFDCKFEDSQNVYVLNLPIVDLGQDMNLEIGNNLSLRNNPSNNQNHYWQDGSTNTSFFIDSEAYGIGVQEFWLQLTDNNACKNSDSISVNIYRKKIHIIELYPNPTRQFITAINNNDISKEIHIYDDRGRYVETIILDKWEKEFDLAILSDGVYVFTITENGGLVEKIKIVKN